jgi:glucans biosynthesis protein
MTPRRIVALLLLVVSGVVVGGCGSGEEPAGVQDGGADAGVSASPGSPYPEPRPYPRPASADALQGWLVERARQLASSTYRPPGPDLPAALASLDYDAYQQIRYRPDRALWRGETPFEVQLFHRGSIQSDRVEIHLVEDGEVRSLPFDPSRFRYDGEAAAAAEMATPGLGWAGFRVHHPMNRRGVADEVVVFLGASYFRLLGPGHVHGLSTRGLAIDVARGEEFPDFRAYWLLRPPPGSDTLTVLALLDSPSVAGAYRFDLTPGQGWGEEAGRPTVTEVEARLFARRDVDKLGVAPLTSMFLHAPGGALRTDDFRPRVHDSQGLLVHAHRGDWLWRPLRNGPALRITTVEDTVPVGWGLAQRERAFEHYLDLQARYHRRPSQWVEPLSGDWGRGSVELVEIPTVSEFNDNVVASWVPEDGLRTGDERRFAYRLRTFDGHLPEERLARAVRTRSGWDALPGEVDPPPRTQRRFVVDFHRPEGTSGRGAVAPAGDGIPLEPRPDAVLEATSGAVSDLQVLPLPEGRGWRASFRLEGDPERTAELRLYLVREDRLVSETWQYLWDPEALG